MPDWLTVVTTVVGIGVAVDVTVDAEGVNVGGQKYHPVVPMWYPCLVVSAEPGVEPQVWSLPSIPEPFGWIIVNHSELE